MNSRTKLLEQYDSLRKAFGDPCDEIIYHYTSAQGFRGIIENNEIWLSNIVFVNDTTECRALQEETDLFSESDFKNKEVKDHWFTFINSRHTERDTYIASFTRSEESLEQWRAYGMFRIGFKASQLITGRFNLYQCVYDHEQIKQWILDKCQLTEWYGDSLTEEYKRVAAWELIYAASRKYKNKHFFNEREVRLVVTSHHTWKPFPNSPSMFASDPPIYYRDHPAYKIPVPYVKLFITRTDMNINTERRVTNETAREMKERKLNEEKSTKRDILPITDVLIGPMPHKGEAKVACDILLKDRGYESVEVNISNIPYRGF